MYELADFSFHHSFEIGMRLRDEDIEECIALGYSSPVEAIIDSVARSDGFKTVYLQGQPVGVFGFTEDDNGGCLVWLTGTDDMLDRPLAFHKAAKAARDSLLEEYHTLYNSVFVGNIQHRKWLEALGATFYLTDDPDFLYFEISI